MKTQYLEKLADLLLWAVSFEGGHLNIQMENGARDLGVAVARKAYERGAEFVDFDYTDHRMRAAAIASGRTDFAFPGYVHARTLEMVGPTWKRIAIITGADRDAYQGLPEASSTAFFKAWNAARKPYVKAITSNQIAWVVTAFPSAEMAASAFPSVPPEAALERYEAAVVDILGLDRDDPRAYWRQKMEESERRSSLLNSWDIERLRFRGPGTDFEVGIAKAAFWVGGFDRTPSGELFVANIPTEEVFTTPDARTARGRVSLTRTFEMHQNLGPKIEGAWFEFEDGLIVDYGAASGKTTLDAFFALDERAKRLGEVAIVDPRSPIAQAGFCFYNGLYDENAACHLALGRSYPSTLKNPADLDDAALIGLGFNPCSVHEDMMVGGPEVEVEAVLADGSARPIIAGGRILI